MLEDFLEVVTRPNRCATPEQARMERALYNQVCTIVNKDEHCLRILKVWSDYQKKEQKWKKQK